MQHSRLLTAFAGLFLLAGPALAQNNVTLENLSWRDASEKALFKAPRVEVANTNLSRDEVAKLFAGETPAPEKAALAARMTAAKVTITGATIDNEGSKLSFGPINVTAIDKGRFANAALDNFTGAFTDKTGAPTGSLTGRTLKLEGGDLGPLLGAIQSNHPEASAFQVARVTWDGFEGLFTDPQATAAAPGADKIKVALRSLTAVTDFKAAMPLSSSVEASGFVLEPSSGSEFGKSLKSFGYDRIELGMKGAGRYDPATQKLVVQEYSLTSPKAGRLALSGEMSGVDSKALSSADSGDRSLALLGASVEGLKVDFVNDGLVEKIFAYAAALQGKSAAALKSEATAMAVQLLPLLLGGDPQSLALAQSVQTFLTTPKNFSLALKARGAPVPLAQLGSIRDPKSFLALINVTLVANQ